MALLTNAQIAASRALRLAILVLAAWLMRSDSSSPIARGMMALPRLTLWAWERPEDLRGIDPTTTAVAYLDQTVRIGGSGALAEPRMQPVAFPAKTARIAVVRIEVERGTLFSPEIRERTLAYLLASARQRGIAALQVDFDATRSERGFYRDLLVDLRRQMPADLPLSMTALASWCSWDDWIGDLPVDEAVPMFFRMEPDRLRGVADRSEYRVRERLCLGSLGVSTRERWPGAEVSGKRMYLFPDRGWRRDGSILTAETRRVKLP